MKTFLKIFVIIIIVFSLSGCGITFTARKVYDKSEIYSKEDIREAMNVVFDEFSDFEGAVLLKLEYDEELSNKQMRLNTKQYDCDEAIVLLSKFYVFGENGSLEPGETYSKWNWILVRNKGGFWELKTWGYG